jgi:hypothetical protein
VHELDVLLRRARAEQDGHQHDGHQSVHADLERSTPRPRLGSTTH